MLHARRRFSVALLLPATLLISGCAQNLDRIDREVDAMIAASNSDMGFTVSPQPTSLMTAREGDDRSDRLTTQPQTTNPGADSLHINVNPAQSDAADVIARLDGYASSDDSAREVDLTAALSCAVANSREHRFAEEEYVLSALRLLTERHRWGPRFFDDVSATVSGDGDDGLFDTSMSLVNEFRVTQRLPYGGEVSARALARATEDLHQHVSGEGTQSMDLIFAADIPLLRGAGSVAREDLIQSERNLVYAARGFERFRREFLFDMSRDFLDLVVTLRRIENAIREVASFRQLQETQEALHKAGRSTPFDAAEAKNDALEAVDRLNSTRESYRLAQDRFKARIGLPIDEPIVVVPTRLNLPIPQADMNRAIGAAMQYRLDLQTRRDQVDDARRSLDNARNSLLGDLDFSAQVTIPTDDDKNRSGADFETRDSDWRVGVAYGLPLDREVERLAVRQRQIALARSERDFERFRDDTAIAVRGTVRGIDAALFSLEIQERNVEIAEQRQRAIEADPARANVRQKTDAINQLSRARNSLESSRRDVDLAVLRFLLETGRLRVEASGVIRSVLAESE